MENNELPGIPMTVFYSLLIAHLTHLSSNSAYIKTRVAPPPKITIKYVFLSVRYMNQGK